jgi:SAM-dependent methyltransferase
VYVVRLPPEDAEQDYDSYYRETVEYPQFVGRSLDRLISRFDAFRRLNRLLDVGFGGAAALEAGRRRGWTCNGVEVSAPAVTRAQQLGFDVFAGDLAAAPYDEGSFDVVIMSEVLEHVPDPFALLSAGRRMIRPGGALWVTTPHWGGLSSRLLGKEWSIVSPPEHLQLFSRRGLSGLLDRSGFRPSGIFTEVFNPMEPLRHLRSKISGKGDGTETFDRVASGYGLLDVVYSRRSLTAAKHVLDWVLRTTRQGDNLRVLTTTAE